MNHLLLLVFLGVLILACAVWITIACLLMRKSERSVEQMRALVQDEFKKLKDDLSNRE